MQGDGGDEARKKGEKESATDTLETRGELHFSHDRLRMRRGAALSKHYTHVQRE